MPFLTLIGMLLLTTCPSMSDPPDQEKWLPIASVGSSERQVLIEQIRRQGSVVFPEPTPMRLMKRCGTGAFTVIGLPDTQNYSELYPEIFLNQTQWVAPQRYVRDIR